jgi:ABC-2 type transport system permease protein
MQAQQLSGVLVLPIVLLMFGQMSGVLFLGVGVILGLGLLMYLLGALLVWIGARTFSRGELMARI